MLMMTQTRKTKLKYALAGVGLPLAVLIGSKLARRKPKQQGKADDRAGRL